MSNQESPILRISQKALADMFARGEAQIVPPKEIIDLLAKEQEAWETFLGKKLETPIPPLPKDLLAAMEKAKKIGWSEAEAHYLPQMKLKQDLDIPGWKVKPEERWYWKLITEGTVDKENPVLDGIWILIDGTQKPSWEEIQIYAHDPFMHLLTKLQEDKKIRSEHMRVALASRLDISFDELQTYVNPAIADLMGVDPKQVRVPKAIEFNVLGNIFHPEWGNTTSWEWFSDAFASSGRLIGGGSRSGGLANVYWSLNNSHNQDLGFRPMIVF